MCRGVRGVGVSGVEGYQGCRGVRGVGVSGVQGCWFVGVSGG